MLERTLSLHDHNLMPESALPQKHRIFISYHSQDPDRSLAQELYQALQSSGHQVFMAAASIRLGESWPQRIDAELQQCDYFLLLLSEKSATSEMVTEEVRRVKELRDANADGKPMILPIRVCFPMSSPLNYKLRGYLDQIQQREWHSVADTPSILQEIRFLLTRSQELATEEPSDFSLKAVPIQTSDLPLPSAEPELPDGQIEVASAFYIERQPIDNNAYEEIKKPGSLIRIKAPRQMGKTSLMARILHFSTQQGYRTVHFNFDLADAKVFTDLDKFLRWFCAMVGRRLRLANCLDDYWDEIFGSKDNCTAYFEEYLLAEIESPLVLALDEVHRVFEYPEIAVDFLGLLRSWHEEAKNSRTTWKKLRLVVVHSTEVYVKMPLTQSPFNVGLAIELPELNAKQINDLAVRHGLSWTGEQIEQLMALVGGHPYLVRLAFYHLAKQKITWETLLQTAATEAGIYGDHLRRNLWMLQQHPELATSFAEVVSSTQPVCLESSSLFKLQSLGLVHLQGNEVTPRCDLYRQYFQERLTLSKGKELGRADTKIPQKPFSGASTLAAIVFTDVVNSTPLMVANEKQMMELLKRDFQLMSESCQRHEGQVLKSMGDGLLMYFVSAVKAVACAVEIQINVAKASTALPAEQILIHRIGIHLADVYFNGDDVLGAGVNVASRLQGKAQPGGICISQTVYEVVKNNLSLKITALGPVALKGITEPVPLYLITPT